MKLSVALFISSLVALLSQAQQSEPVTSFGPYCFTETQLYGRADVGDAQEIAASDKTELDNIPLSEFGNASRVSMIKYCFDTRTAYLKSVQAGLTNGIGSEVKWLNTIGLDDKVSAANTECGMYHVEREDYRVAELEIGSVTAGLPNTQGIIWLAVTVRHVKNLSPTPFDVTF